MHETATIGVKPEGTTSVRLFKHLRVDLRFLVPVSSPLLLLAETEIADVILSEPHAKF